MLSFIVQSHKPREEGGKCMVEIRLEASKAWNTLVKGRSRITVIECNGKPLGKPVELSAGNREWQLADGVGWEWVIKSDAPFAPRYKTDRLVVRVEHEAIHTVRGELLPKHKNVLQRLKP